MLTRTAFIWLKNAVKSEILWTYYSCNGKADFSASLLQSSVSRDPSEIIKIHWFSVQETILIINAKFGWGGNFSIYYKLLYIFSKILVEI